MKQSSSGWAQRSDIRWLAAILIIGLALYYLLPRLGELDNIGGIVRHANPGWLLAAVAAALGTYAMAAFALTGSTKHRLPWRQAFLIQIASTVLNRTTPKGIGSIAMAEQYLERKGLRRAEAAASITLIYTAGIAVHLVLLLGTFLVLQPNYFDIPTGQGQTALTAIVVLMGCAGLLLLPRFKRLLARWAGEIRRGLAYDARHPAKLLQLVGGSAGITLCHVFGLYFAMLAVGSDVMFLTAMFVYLAGSAVASPSPTPGGLGATEAALALGLTAAGEPAGQALAGVLIFRLCSFWLPLLPGAIALRLAIRRKLI